MHARRELRRYMSIERFRASHARAIVHCTALNQPASPHLAKVRFCFIFVGQAEILLFMRTYPVAAVVMCRALQFQCRWAVTGTPIQSLLLFAPSFYRCSFFLFQSQACHDLKAQRRRGVISRPYIPLNVGCTPACIAQRQTELLNCCFICFLNLNSGMPCAQSAAPLGSDRHTSAEPHW
jgi:hypothetical protein